LWRIMGFKPDINLAAILGSKGFTSNHRLRI
jgi:hypothetical protein